MPLLERLLLRGHIDRIKPADQDISTLDGHWTAENVVLFVGAVGAVTRLIAARIQGKEKDPAVLVCLTRKENSSFRCWEAIPQGPNNAPGKSPWISAGRR